MRPSEYEALTRPFRWALWVVDGLGELLLSRGHRPEVIRREEIRSILAVMTYGLGDAVLASGCLKAVIEHLPNARVDVLVSPRSRSVVEILAPGLNLIDFDNPIYRLRDGRSTQWSASRATIRELRRRNYDLCIDFQGDFANAWAMRAMRARYRVGHATMGGGFFLTHPVPRDPECRSAVDINAEALGPLGIVAGDVTPRLTLPDGAQNAADALLAECGLTAGSYIVVAPGALLRWKTWPASSFAQLSRTVLGGRGWRTLIVGGPADVSVSNEVAEAIGPSAVNRAGRVPLGVTLGLIRQAVAFVGNDSGLVHAARALDVPTVQVFGPGIPERFGYIHPRHANVFEDCDPLKCGPYRCATPENWCMGRITPERVYKELLRILAR